MWDHVNLLWWTGRPKAALNPAACSTFGALITLLQVYAEHALCLLNLALKIDQNWTLTAVSWSAWNQSAFICSTLLSGSYCLIKILSCLLFLSSSVFQAGEGSIADFSIIIVDGGVALHIKQDYAMLLFPVTLETLPLLFKKKNQIKGILSHPLINPSYGGLSSTGHNKTLTLHKNQNYTNSE